LWIYLCDWELFYKGEVILASSDDNSLYCNVINHFDGVQFSSISESTFGSEIELTFSHGYTLILKPNTEVYDTEDDLFIFYIEGESEIAYSVELGFYTS